ncbi:hypothetical protein ZIOFF_044288 [Zingiber officinale]|uniref:CDP-diacylglycerol--serine O-phosphatidyltransferase n=1 Tax=Zingiber officinale TaxID=94328 RepID=A0A8J5L061_ZINOF|nr:hypothetical protein ZIOFF_044288 [Zingiber officinale]
MLCRRETTMLSRIFADVASCPLLDIDRPTATVRQRRCATAPVPPTETSIRQTLCRFHDDSCCKNKTFISLKRNGGQTAFLGIMEANGQGKTPRDCKIREENGAKFQSDFGELDPWTAWAYKPRTITLLFIGTCLLVWASGALDPESTASTDIVTSVKRGVWAMIAVFLAYSLLQAPSTVLIRPHPAIWRLVHGMAVVYLVALTFLLFQVKRTLGQFTPAKWDKDEWHPLLGPLRFIQVLCLCVVFMTVELNTFFLKFCLWVPPRNPLIVYRLVLWWLIAIPTIREYNTYLQDRSLPQPNASMADNFLDNCRDRPIGVSSCLDLADSSIGYEEETIIIYMYFFPSFCLCKYLAFVNEPIAAQTGNQSGK